LVTQEIKDAFKGTGIPVYPSTGNHDTWPVNMMDFTEPGANRPIADLVDTWSEWIGEEAAQEFAQWGYCSVPFKFKDYEISTANRVLVLNTQATNKANYYMAGFKNDPAGQLEWLES